MTLAIHIYANDKPASQRIKADLEAALQDHVRLVEDHEKKDIVLTVGGDGTLLSAFHNHLHELETVQFIGVHTGHLGFYTDWMAEDLPQLIDCLKRGASKAVSYPLLKIHVELRDGSQETFLALNECSVRSSQGTSVVDVSVRGYFFETFRGDGICISTPTGSTGLNKSLGGAVIHPRLNALQLTEMASINNRVYRTLSAPMIIPEDEWIDLDFHVNPEALMHMTIDNFYLPSIDILSLQAQIAQERIQFASFKHTHFWDRVEGAFLDQKGRV